MMSSFPSSSLIRAASGIPLIATPSTESASICRFSSSSSTMSDIAAAMNPMRFPYTPTDRHPIFTSFGGSPPLMPRVRSQVTVSGDRCNSSAISFSERPFSLYSMALFAIEFTSFMRSPTPRRTMRDAGYQDIGLARGLFQNPLRCSVYNPTFFSLPSSLTHGRSFSEVLHQQRTRVQDRYRGSPPRFSLVARPHAGTRRPLLSRRNLPNSSSRSSCLAVKMGPSRQTSWSSNEHASPMPIPHFMYRSRLA